MKPRQLPSELQDIIMEYYGHIPEKKELSVFQHAVTLSNIASRHVYDKLTGDELQLHGSVNAAALFTFLGCLPPAAIYATLRKASIFAIKPVKQCIDKNRNRNLENIFVDSSRFKP